MADVNYCRDSAGDTLPNPDNELFKSWTLVGSVLVDCEWGEDWNFAGSGVRRETSEAQQQVFGSFSVTGGPGAGSYDCSFDITNTTDDSDSVDSTLNDGSCTDAAGTAWADLENLSLGQSCSVSFGTASMYPPTAVCGADGSGYALDTANFDGSGSTDPLGRPITFSWELLAQPEGSSATFSSLTAASPTMVMDLVGTYTAQLTVSSIDGGTDSCTQTFEATSYENFRIEMWWDNADDMDLHLLEANGGSPRTGGDCYYANCMRPNPYWWISSPDWGVPGYDPDDPHLDLDDIWGTGPENINIDEPAGSPYDGWYEVFVHDYAWTARYFDANGVHVNIYLDGALAKSYDFTISDENNDYYVAKIHWPTGEIIDCNGLSGCP